MYLGNIHSHWILQVVSGKERHLLHELRHARLKGPEQAPGLADLEQP